jgi:hypothetical protein
MSMSEEMNSKIKIPTHSDDAMKWATAFCGTAKEQEWELADIDEGLIVGWFANYWAAVYDPLNSTIEQLTKERDELIKVLERVDCLMDDSFGVAGLHLNGEIAPWDSLLEGGCYEGWLGDLVQVLARHKEGE